MSTNLKKKLEELGRIENRLRREERKLADLRRAMKEQLLAGASIESGDVYAELRLLPGRDPLKQKSGRLRFDPLVRFLGTFTKRNYSRVT